MARFEDLPNEIVLELWRYISTPSDIVNLAAVSKATYGMGADSLREHHRLRSQYSVIDNRIKGRGSVLARVVRDVLVNPDIGLYVKTLRVSDWRLCWDSEDEDVPDKQDPALGTIEPLVWRLPNRKDDVSLFAEALVRTEQKLDYHPDSVEWVDIMEGGDEDPLIVLLLLLLPNLTEFHLYELPEDTWTIDMFHRIAESPATGFLCHLTDVELSPNGIGAFENTSMIKPFALIPSVRRITCQSLMDQGYQHGAFDCNMPHQISNVTHLTFEGCGDIKEGLSCLLKGFKGLRSFTYKSPLYQDPKAERKLPFDAHTMCYILSSNAQYTLETLSIDGLSQQFVSARRSNSMGTLSHFKALKTVNTEYDLLVDRSEKKDKLDIFHALPFPIEEINLRVCQDDINNQVRLFTTYMLNEKSSRLIKFRKLTFNTCDGNETEVVGHIEFPNLKEACRVNGIDFKFFRPIDPSIEVDPGCLVAPVQHQAS